MHDSADSNYTAQETASTEQYKETEADQTQWAELKHCHKILNYLYKQSQHNNSCVCHEDNPITWTAQKAVKQCCSTRHQQNVPADTKSQFSLYGNNAADFCNQHLDEASN